MTVTWSPTKVRRYRTCPRQWALMEAQPRGRRAEFDHDLPLPFKLGIIEHAALQAAYEVARDGLRPFRVETMAVFADAALSSLDAALEGFGLAEAPEAAQLEEELLAVLDRLPRPRPGAILGIEHRLDDVVDGVPFTNILDLILQTGATSLHLRDWKRRNVKALPTTLELLDDPQMGSYRCAAARHFPWATRMTVGLYSLISNREVTVELPLTRAQATMADEVATTRTAEKDTVCRPTPDGSNCQRCSVKPLCPVWTVSQQL
jgi:PD-(D/E)XK nuclease superfamily